MSTPNAGLVLHLNFAEVADGKLTDLSGNGNDGTLQGNPQLLPDDTFGSCLSFDGAADYVSLPAAAGAGYGQGFTFEAWVLYDSLAQWSRVFDFGNGSNGDNLLLANEATTGNLILHVYRGGTRIELRADNTLKTGEWTHLAATLDSSGAGVLYVNGRQAAAGPVQLPVALARANNYIGKSNWTADALFKGKIASARVYSRALSADEVKADMEDDKTAAATFRASYPLNFKLYDRDDNQQVVYITDHPQGRQVSFEVSNTSRKAVMLSAPASAQVSAQNYHFKLRLRAGTLSEEALKRLALAESGWTMLKPTPEQAAQDGGAVSLYFLSASELTLNPSDKLTLTLSGVAADPGAGARGTRAELRFSQMGYPGDATPLTGTRIQHLNVVNQRGQKLIPLHVGFLDSDRVLNDGTSQNTLRLRITNVSKLPLALTPTPPDDAATKLVITFDIRADTASTGNDWALGTASQVNAINVTAQGWTPSKPEAKTPEWVLTTTQTALAPGAAVEVMLDGIVTSLPSGLTNLYLRYENVPGHWDGQFIVSIEKAPVVYHGDRVGIGASDPQAKLQVKGGAIMPASGSNETSGILFPKDPGGGSGDAAWLRYYVRQGENTTLELGTSNDAADHIALMPSGNVGVGTNTPEVKLHVVTTNNVTARVQSSSNIGTWFGLQNTTTGGGTWYIVSTGSNNGEGAGRLLFKQEYSGPVYVTLDPKGNLGVGTEQPQARLSVNGGVHIGGNPTDPGASNLQVDGKVLVGGSARNILQQGFSISFPSTKFKYNTSGNFFSNINSSGIKVITDRSGVLSTGKFDVLTWYDYNGIPEVVVYGKIWGTEKNFAIDHPTRPGHKLVHSCLEGPEVGVFYRGSARLADGEATVRLPDYFEALTLKQDRTVTLTAKGREPYLLSYEEIRNGEFKVYGTKPDGEFSWEVKAVRADVEALKVEVKSKD